jgi:hypothetical protein
MRGHRLFAGVACALCLVATLAGAGEARAAQLRTIPAPAGLSAIGCMSSALCVVSGVSAAHDSAHIQILQRGRVTHTVRFSQAFIGKLGISCPSARECVVVIDHGVAGSTLMTISAGGRLSSPRPLPRAHHASFDQISCASVRRCELAGEWTVGRRDDGDEVPIVASWNGSRAGRVYALPTPAYPKHVYQLDADLSCGGARCEVSYTVSFAIKSAVHLSTTVDGGPPHTVRIGDVYQLRVACAGNGDCEGALDSPFLGYNSRIGQIIDGHLRDDRPSLHLEAADLACHVNACLAVGMGVNKSALVSVTDGHVGAPQTVRAVRDYLSVAAIPGGGFVAVGYGGLHNRMFVTFTTGR